MRLTRTYLRMLKIVRSIRLRRLILGLSILIGLTSGLAAVLLKNLAHFIELKSKSWLLGGESSDLPFLLPLVGITFTVLFVKYLLKQDIGHGVSKILFSISRRKGHLKPHNLWSSMLASSMTVGTGGSVGLEAPIVLTGSAIGSNLGRALKLDYKSVVLLVGCGAAGAIAGIFKAPIAALIFAFEVLMLDLTTWSIVPLLLSSVTAAIVASFLLGKQVVFFYTISEPFHMSSLPFYILLGVFSGLVSVYFTRMNNMVEGTMGRIRNTFLRMVTGGLLLSALIFLMPHLFGEGYTTLKTLLTGHSSELFDRTLFEHLVQRNAFYIILFFALLLVLKVIAMALTTGGGGVGGIFAPALFVGGMSGAFLSRVINLSGQWQVSENNFALVGMAGVMAGVMQAPLTAIFLIAEVTGGYALFIPLIVVATISYVTIRGIEPQSIYTKRLAQRGELMTHHKDKTVLTLLTVKDVLEKDFKKVKLEGNLGDLVKVISESRRNLFPVINNDEELVGVINMDDIRDILFNTELYEKVKIPELMRRPPAVIDRNDPMEQVLETFEETGAWNLPVTGNGKYIGFISRSKIFSNYRNLLKEFSDD